MVVLEGIIIFIIIAVALVVFGPEILAAGGILLAILIGVLVIFVIGWVIYWAFSTVFASVLITNTLLALC